MKKKKDGEKQLDFVSKVNWEGGVIDALVYGLSYKDLPKCKLKTIWNKLEKLYTELEPLLEEYDEEAEKIVDEYADESWNN